MQVISGGVSQIVKRVFQFSPFLEILDSIDFRVDTVEPKRGYETRGDRVVIVKRVRWRFVKSSQDLVWPVGLLVMVGVTLKPE